MEQNLSNISISTSHHVGYVAFYLIYHVKQYKEMKSNVQQISIFKDYVVCWFRISRYLLIYIKLSFEF